jgi:hypothetical protein
MAAARPRTLSFGTVALTAFIGFRVCQLLRRCFRKPQPSPQEQQMLLLQQQLELEQQQQQQLPPVVSAACWSSSAAAECTCCSAPPWGDGIALHACTEGMRCIARMHIMS